MVRQRRSVWKAVMGYVVRLYRRQRAIKQAISRLETAMKRYERGL